MATTAMFFIEGKLPKAITEAMEQWFLSINVLPRSRKNLQRNLNIYKNVVNERRSLEEVAELFELSAHFVKQIVRKICLAINAKLRREEVETNLNPPAEQPVDTTDVEQKIDEVVAEFEDVPVKQDNVIYFPTCNIPVEEQTKNYGESCGYLYHHLSCEKYKCPACGQPEQPVMARAEPKSLVTMIRDGITQFKRWIRS